MSKILLNWAPVSEWSTVTERPRHRAAAGGARAEALAEMEAAAAEGERLTDTTTIIILIITRRTTPRPAAALPPVAGGGIQGRRSVDSAPRFIGFTLIAPEIVYLSFLRTVVSQMNN